MTYKSTQVAKKFLELAKNNDATLTPMQLIKLVYLAHGWMLALYNRPLITDDIEAWKYGPVIPDLYHAVKNYRSHPVKTINDNNTDIAETIDDEANNIIQQVYNKYGRLSGITLSALTHLEGSPWEITWSKERVIISNDLILDYYQRLINHDK